MSICFVWREALTNIPTFPFSCSPGLSRVIWIQEEILRCWYWTIFEKFLTVLPELCWKRPSGDWDGEGGQRPASHFHRYSFHLLLQEQVQPLTPLGSIHMHLPGVLQEPVLNKVLASSEVLYHVPLDFGNLVCAFASPALCSSRTHRPGPAGLCAGSPPLGPSIWPFSKTESLS